MSRSWRETLLSFTVLMETPHADTVLYPMAKAQVEVDGNSIAVVSETLLLDMLL